MAKSKSIDIDLVKFASCAALLLVAYLPTIKWMIDRWMAPESYYGHGFLIPVVSAYVAWGRRDAIKAAPVSSDARGLLLIAGGLIAHIASAALRVYFISGFTMILVLLGLILFFYGREVMKQLVFPVFFLLAMVPLPLVLVSTLTVKLKLAVAQVATFILNRIGFPSIRDGNIIRMPGSYTIVGAPCSGLRSLIALLTLGLIFAFAAKFSKMKKSMLFLSSVPIALVTNVGRVALLCIVNDLYGEKAATGFFHDATGFLVFALAFVMLMGMNRMLETVGVAGSGRGSDE